MSAGDPARFGRPVGLLVRYWACNMTLVHDQGAVWPGFGYTLGEQAALRAIARRVDAMEFWIWLALTAVLAVGFLAGLAVFGAWLLGVIGGGPHALDVTGPVFIIGLGVQLVASFAVGMPAAMLLAGLLTGKLCGVTDADLPDVPVRAHYVHKLGGQFLRAALLSAGGVVAACLWLPERVWLLTRGVLPVLGPAVSVATTLWFLHRPAAPPQGEVRDSTSSRS